MPYTYEYPRPALTVDCVVFGFQPGSDLQVLLIERAEKPYKGRLAFAGGHVEVSYDDHVGETIEAAAWRELKEETGIVPDHLEQLYTFGGPWRDPRGYYVTVAYMALVRSLDHVAVAGSDALDARWYSVTDARGRQLAFDHSEILRVAVERLRGKIRYVPIGFNLLPKAFSMGDLRSLYESILGKEIDPSNFRKRILGTGVLRPAGKQKGVAHRPGTLWQFDRAAYDRACKRGINFEV